MDLDSIFAELARGGVSEADVSAVHKCIAECRDKLVQIRFPNMEKVPTDIKVYFDLSGAVAGRAYTVGDARIRINPALFKRYREGFFKSTIPHEYAHIVANKSHECQCHHDWRWQRVMIYLGVPPKRCHNYDVTGIVKRRQRYAVYCDCTTHNITSVRLRRLRQGTAYRCKWCNTPIKEKDNVL